MFKAFLEKQHLKDGLESFTRHWLSCNSSENELWSRETTLPEDMTAPLICTKVEDEISADEMEKLKNEMEGFPSDFVLPKDTTGTSTAHDMYMMHGLFTIIHQFATCEICACSP